MLSGKYQLAAKIESTEGTAESLVAADAKILAYDLPNISFDPTIFDSNIKTASLSKTGKRIGQRPGTLTCRLGLRGSGTATTEPEWFKLLKACGFEVNALESIDIGAVTGGPFVHGETITGGTSGATGRVVIETANGASNIYYVIISGTFQDAETITGGTSSASATSSSSPTTIGNEVKPASSSISSLTMAGYEDGFRRVIKGARGKFKFVFKAGDPVMLDFEFMGVESAIGDVALLSDPGHEITKPPVLLNAGFSIGGYAAKVGAMEIDIANILAPRDDINDPKGILSFLISGREYPGSFDAEMVLAAAYDFYTKWLAETEEILDLTIGSVAGNKFRLYGPKTQYVKLDKEDKEGIVQIKSAFVLNGTVAPGDDEFTMLVL